MIPEKNGWKLEKRFRKSVAIGTFELARFVNFELVAKTIYFTHQVYLWGNLLK
jgi:hypothetical protein